MIKTIWHWKNIRKYIFYGSIVIIGWSIVMYLFSVLFDLSFLISALVALIGGLFVGIFFSHKFSKKHPLYTFE